MKKLILGIGVAIMALATAHPANAATTFPGENDAIAFTKGAHGRTWAVNPVNGEAEPLLRPGSSDVAWAPGGKRLAYVRGGYIFVAAATGRTVYHVPHRGGAFDSAPQWSSDGTKLAFVRTLANARSAVYSVRVGSYAAKNVSGWSEGINYRAPSWAPNGRQMVYEEYNETAARLLVRNLTTRSVRELTPLSDVTGSSQASWSPNGKKILFRDSAQELYTIWADGTHRAVISDGESYSGSWSPNGSNIAFIEAPGDDHISVSEADGTVKWLPVDKGAYDQLGAPVWSPDGTKLAFTLAGNPGRDVFVLDITTGTQKLVTKNAGAEMLSWRAVRPRR